MEKLGDWVVFGRRALNPSDVDGLCADVRVRSCCAVVNASLVCGQLQLAVAIQRLAAQLVAQNGVLRTRHIASELLLMLSPTRNIQDAMQIFSCSSGSSDSPPCTAILCCLYRPSREDLAYVIDRVSRGEPLPLAELAVYCDEERIAKTYHIGKAELVHCGLLSCVVNKIATADI